MTERRLVVLYGSQTGTAEEVAERAGREGERLHFSSVVSSMDGFPLTELPTSALVIYVAATTGQGEEPDNMKKTWRFLLRKNLPPNSLENQRFGVLGLGDSGYPKFNHVAKKLSKRLVQLGGVQLLAPGLGDDQHDLGPDFVIDSWLETFWRLALQLYPLPPGLLPVSKEVRPAPRFVMARSEGADGRAEETAGGLAGCPVISCERQTPPGHFQDVRLLRINIRDAALTYSPGDVALVQPENLQENIDFFFKLFPHIDPDKPFTLTPSNPRSKMPNLPQPCTMRFAVRHYLDIQSIPKRYFFELLSHFTTDELEKEKFIEFTTAEGQQDLYDYCNRPRRNILEVLHDFRHTTPNIPEEYLWDLIPAIKPRSFSIASSPSYHGDVLELLVAVVNYSTVLKSPRKGLCSTWISRLKTGDVVNITTKKGTLKFPEAPTPIVMVGPGTGIAPFRSFLLDNSAKQRPCLLYFGSRNREADFFFEEDWKRLENLEVVTAFSRDQEDKVYVQHRMKETKEKLCRWECSPFPSLLLNLRSCRFLLAESGWLFVAGSSKNMPGQVRTALVSALSTELGEDQAELFVENLEKTGKYQMETWS